MTNFNYNTVVPQYSTNLYSGNYVPTNSGWLLSPAQNTVTSPVQGDSFTSSPTGNDGKFDYSIDDGKISFGDKLKNVGKGLISPITNMFSSPKNFLIGAGMMVAGAALMIGTAGAAAPILIAAGVTAGAVQLGTGAYKAATAKTDAEAEAAWQGIGAGTTSVGLSVLGAKTSLKAAGFADDAANMNMLQATAKCFKVAPSQAVKSGNMIASGEAAANIKNFLGIKPKADADTNPKTTDDKPLSEKKADVDAETKPVEKPVEEKTEVKPKIEPKTDRAVLIENAKNDFVNNRKGETFMGIYEPLERVAQGKSKNMLNAVGDWDTRMGNLKDADSLKTLWDDCFPTGKSVTDLNKSELQQVAAKFMDIMKKDFGVKRMESSGFLVDSDTYGLFTTESGEIIEAGNRVKTILPAWINDKGVVLEKGRIDAAV